MEPRTTLLRTFTSLPPDSSSNISDSNTVHLRELDVLRAEVDDLTRRHRQSLSASHFLPATDFQVAVSRVKRKPPPPLSEEGNSSSTPSHPSPRKDSALSNGHDTACSTPSTPSHPSPRKDSALSNGHDTACSTSVSTSRTDSTGISITVATPPEQEASLSTPTIALTRTKSLLGPQSSPSLPSSRSWWQRLQNALPSRGNEPVRSAGQPEAQGQRPNRAPSPLATRSSSSSPRSASFKPKSPLLLLPALITPDASERRLSYDPPKISRRPSLAIIHGRTAQQKQQQKQQFQAYKYQRAVAGSAATLQGWRSSSHVDSSLSLILPEADAVGSTTAPSSAETSPTLPPHSSIFTQIGKADPYGLVPRDEGDERVMREGGRSLGPSSTGWIDPFRYK
ncbi:hypothetical protein CF319_g5787 [Tilletia indica]|nr:hypothetical protein CF319_g5787 [Tilletia indica]KAE8228604.1 hypothetical protein CF326_g6457 [Tilletia indica]